MKPRSLLNLFAAALFLCASAALAAFDPVNDDTDIFLANPNVTGERPNVLIILDNTANWGSTSADGTQKKFDVEKPALVSVVNGLDDIFNVGLMMFPETGGGNDSVDGGYVRFHVRQMTSTNKTALATMVNALDILGDKGNNATTGLAMYEAYLYFAGKASKASFGKVKTDFAGNTANNPLAAPLTGHALPANPTATSLYSSPVAASCAKNFIIYISNGPANENANARDTLQGYLATLTGVNPPSTILINPNGQQPNWADETAKFMANADVNANVTGSQNVITYTVEVDPGTTGGGPDMTALLKSMADNGKGKYFAVSSGGAGTSIVNALNQIFTEVQAVNSVFASTTLPVSVNVRGTNLNQVYIGVFRPDPFKAPRWLGNLKLYNLALDTTTNTVFLADASNGIPPAVGNRAENQATGFIGSNASSFWTVSSTFWSFRDASQNGAGGGSDKPDGDLVEKGGAAQQIRTTFAAAEASSPKRNIYTCTTGSGSTPNCDPCSVSGSGSTATCSGGSSLSATPFSTDNSHITDSSLALGTVQTLSSLTAFVSKPVTSLTDQRTVTLNNALSSQTVNLSFSGGISTKTPVTLNNLGTAKTITALSALTNVSATVNISSITKSGNDGLATTATAHGFANGSTVTIANNKTSGGTSSVFNGTFTITSVPSTTEFKFGTFSGNPADGTATGTAAGTNTANSTTAVATVASHGLQAGDKIKISGITSPSQFNGDFTVLSNPAPTTNTFAYTISSAAGAATLGATPTVQPRLLTVTATVSAGHGLTVGCTTACPQVTLSGASPTGYNGTYIVASVPNTTTFTYQTASQVSPDNTGTVTMTTGSSTTVTATKTDATALGLTNGESVDITGAIPNDYNGNGIIITSTGASANSFTYTRPRILAPATTTATVSVSGANSAIVTATLANHGFNVGDTVTIAGASPTTHNGNWTVLTTPTTDTFTYSTGVALSSPTGTNITVRSNSPVKAFAAVTAHGYSTGDSITIKGATPSGYNGAKTITVLDANTFRFDISSALGPATGTITANKPGTTATAILPAHGLAVNNTVTIAGANETDFNGSITVTAVPDPSTFTYTIGNPQGDATTSTGITATLPSIAGAKDTLINWVRGQDNLQDENANTSYTDIRASVHGDVLHSRPAVINYNRFGSDNDVYVFYGANDGVFHAVKGGYATDGTDPDAISPGGEAWGFVPSEFFSQLKRVRNNSPIISSTAKKPYFADGPIGVLTKDADNNGKLGDTGDIVNLYIATRRGGRFIYALDVNNPTAPKFLWRISNGTTGFGELGYTWSEPKVVSGINGYSNPVLIFAAGYDPTVEDLDSCTITATTATTVTASVGGAVTSSSTLGCTVSGGTPTTFTRTMGRGIYVVDAITGAKVWSAGRTGSGATLEVSGMDFAIPSDIAVIKNESGGPINRAYVGDTGGNLWRIDFDLSTSTGTRVTKIASIADQSSPKGMRKFLFPPDVVMQTGFDAILIGSGDREHPFDSGVTNRFYMFKDRGDDTGPLTGTTGSSGANPTILEGGYPSATPPIPAMFDATSDCIQVAANCTGSGSQLNQTTAQSALGTSTGWFITLGSGEKVVGNAVALAGTVFFNTNQPSTVASSETCGSDLGVARQYQVGVADATATSDLNASGGLSAADRSLIAAGGGYLPSPVHVVVMLEGKPVEAVISGVQVSTPAGVTLQSRLRKYWYKEID